MQSGQLHPDRRSGEKHPPDEELLLFSDQELPTRRASDVRAHIAQCEICSSRLIELEDASAAFDDLREQEIRARNAASPDLLKARLAAASLRDGGARLAFFANRTGGPGMGRQLASAAVALLLVIVATWAVRTIALRRSSGDDSKTQIAALPKRGLTPGSTRAVEIADLCGASEVDNDPPVNPALEQAVFREYGLSGSAREKYAVDYLITPALGGAGNIQNLWPQPYSSTWNARVKDQLEDHLHELVCQGKVRLATAQGDIASNWIAAYKRYFDTDKPEPGSLASAREVHKHRFELNSRGRLTSEVRAAYHPTPASGVGSGARRAAIGELQLPRPCRGKPNI